ncbi:hypothetical protein SDC9_189465 [bioreactor metagenome]|uniref:Uncharacterized protein n=1 Tax=bioreactor metagenome TaxID=1076179 RepID=A0A645HST3_9ZZZZ
MTGVNRDFGLAVYLEHPFLIIWVKGEEAISFRDIRRHIGYLDRGAPGIARRIAQLEPDPDQLPRGDSLHTDAGQLFVRKQLCVFRGVCHRAVEETLPVIFITEKLLKMTEVTR